jgi:hypothetical protein
MAETLGDDELCDRGKALGIAIAELVARTETDVNVRALGMQLALCSQAMKRGQSLVLLLRQVELVYAGMLAGVLGQAAVDVKRGLL